MGSPLILVVDDEPSVRDLIADALNLAGYKSISAAHGLEALTKLRENQIDFLRSIKLGMLGDVAIRLCG